MLLLRRFKRLKRNFLLIPVRLFLRWTDDLCPAESYDFNENILGLHALRERSGRNAAHPRRQKVPDSGNQESLKREFK